jgi:hypothetical protein
MNNKAAVETSRWPNFSLIQTHGARDPVGGLTLLGLISADWKVTENSPLPRASLHSA